MRRCVLLLTLALFGGPPAASADEPTHWSFVKPARPEPPAVRDRAWVRNPLDAFVLARLEKAGLKPAAPAERAALLRRVTEDLTGLPPTPEELDAFLKDERPDAYERVVDRLLASPHFGERWAQHWLDVARYAESNGYESDAERPHAWRYRDYVVRAFNNDKPFDRFVTEQLAGDLLARGLPEGAPERAELLAAAGFNRCGPVHLTSGNLDAEVGRQEVLTEMTAAVGSAFLGLTLGCARCHDHKFDPVSQADYYRVQAFFAAAQPRDVDLASAEDRAAHARRLKEVTDRLAPLKRDLAALEQPYRDRLTAAKKARLEPACREALDLAPAKRTPEQNKLVALAQPLIKVTWDEVVQAVAPPERARRAELRRQIHELEAQRPPPPPAAWTVDEGESAPATYVLKRGDPKQKGSRVEPNFPAALRRPPGVGPALPLRDRLDLAAWLTRPGHPLTGRVIANRLWQHHFGRGLVETPNDFGLRGTPPSHPELLDWLARELVEHGWSLKHLHRLMVLSSAYRQGSKPADAAAARRLDPDNRLLSRMNRRRLSGEGLRDAVLAAAGTLNPKLGGPMVRVPLEPEVYDLIFTEEEPDGLWPVTPDPAEHTRRSLYLYAKRNVRLPLLEAFDQPDTLTSCPVRPVSTSAPQALILFNGPFFQSQGKALAVRLLREAPGREAEGRKARVERAYRLALARGPKEAELATALEFLEGQAELVRERLRARLPAGLPTGLPEGADPAEAAALADFCLALFNRNEFVYVP
jgi:hypothetical protein